MHVVSIDELNNYPFFLLSSLDNKTYYSSILLFFIIFQVRIERDRHRERERERQREIERAKERCVQ